MKTKTEMKAEQIERNLERYINEKKDKSRILNEIMIDMREHQSPKNLGRTESDICPFCNFSKIYHAFSLPYFIVHRIKWATSEAGYQEMVRSEHQDALFDVAACGECRALFVQDSYRGLVEYVEAHPLYRSETIQHWFEQSHFPMTEDVCYRIARHKALSPAEINYRHHMDRLIPFLKHGGRFMDIGANVGTFAALLASQAPHTAVHACETNPAFLSEGQDRYPHLDWIGQPLTDQPKLEPFDLLHVCDVIEHIWDVDAFVKALRAHLRPDGYVIIVTPDGDHASAKREGADWWAYIVPHHCQVLTILSLDRLMARHGLRRIDYAPDGEEFWAVYQLTSNTAPDQGYAHGPS